MTGSHARRGDDLPPVGHGHGAGLEEAVEMPRTARFVLLGSLVLTAILVVAGVAWLWPDDARVEELGEQVQFAAPGVTIPDAEVLEVQAPCPQNRPSSSCGQVRVRVAEGSAAGTETAVAVPPEVLRSSLAPGDTVRLIQNPVPDGTPATFGYLGVDRTLPVMLLTVLFVVAVIAVARLRGVLALLGLAFAGLVVIGFVLPALLAGESGLLVGCVGSAAIMYVVLYTTHGFSLRTSAALAGTLVGVALTAGLGSLAVSSTRLTGVADDAGGVLSAVAGDLSFQGLLACAVVVAGLGVLNDVTITQASAVWELRAAAPRLSRAGVFSGAMRIGRDHIASTIYTIVFAYAGTALLLLLVLSLYGLPLLDLLATEEIGQEVVRTLATSIGLVLAVPLTTLIAVATLPPAVAVAEEGDG